VVGAFGLVWAKADDVGLASAGAEDVSHLAARPADVVLGLCVWGGGTQWKQQAAGEAVAVAANISR
jgi:hypothetical protein